MENEKRHWDKSNDRRDGKFVKNSFDSERKNKRSFYRDNNDTRSKSFSEDKKQSDFSGRRFDNNKPTKVTFRKRRNRINSSSNERSNAVRPIYKKDYLDPNKPIRLNKYLANAGVCSRREADAFISAGVISVNDKIVSELGTKVLPNDNVKFHNQSIVLEQKVYILINKPKDTVTTVEDTHHRKTVMDIVKNACSERVYPVGRLDRNTTGVLLITNDGELTTKLIHPKHNMKKIYHVGLNRKLETEDMEKILSGVDLGDFTVKADAIEFVKENNRKEVGLEIHSGQNRVVRRIFDSLGYKVVKLDRVFFAGLTKKNVPRGKYRFLTEKEVNMLKMGAFEK